MSYSKLGNWYDQSSSGTIQDGATPLSAATMNHMEQGIADAHVDIATLKDFCLNSTIDIETGSYVGTGTYTTDIAENPTTILFKKGKPMFVVVLRETSSSFQECKLFAIRGQQYVNVYTGSTNSAQYYTMLAWKNKTADGWKVVLHSFDIGGKFNAMSQMNISGSTYYYMGLVKKDSIGG